MKKARNYVVGGDVLDAPQYNDQTFSNITLYENKTISFIKNTLPLKRGVEDVAPYKMCCKTDNTQI